VTQILVVCDSIGSPWGAKGFAHTLRDLVGEDITVSVHVYAGVPIQSILKTSLSSPQAKYDCVIVHVGNPDVHPRMPRRPLKALRSKGLTFCRDGLFSLPPFFSIQWLLRFPFFLFRVILTRIYREHYASVDEIVQNHIRLTDHLAKTCSRIIVIPLYEVPSIVYGAAHNIRTRAVNASLQHHYETLLFDRPSTSRAVYRRFYNWDAFHLRQPYHELLARDLLNAIDTH